MLEAHGDIWTVRQSDDWVVITTNSTIRKDGCLVMGRGIALEAAQRYPWIQKSLGELIKSHGLQLEVFLQVRLIAFPVKYDYWEKADLALIEKSTMQLVELSKGITGRILLGRPGCGFGHLDWAEVEPMMRHYLVDNRFIIFTK